MNRNPDPDPPARRPPSLVDGSQIDDGRAQRLGHRDDHPRIRVERFLLVNPLSGRSGEAGGLSDPSSTNRNRNGFIVIGPFLAVILSPSSIL